MNPKKIINEYGLYTFSDEVMKEKLPIDIYNAFHETLNKKEPLSTSMASKIAKAMKEWAIEQGATHFSHWFAPLSGQSAEKHDAFLEIKDDKAFISVKTKFAKELLESRYLTIIEMTLEEVSKANYNCVITIENENQIYNKPETKVERETFISNFMY